MGSRASCTFHHGAVGLMGSAGRSRSTLTYSFFSGCTPGRHASIVLRGVQPSQVASLKKVTRCAVYIAYSLRLELALQLDQGTAPQTLINTVGSMVSSAVLLGCSYSADSVSRLQSDLSCSAPLTLPIRLSPFLDFQSVSVESFAALRSSACHGLSFPEDDASLLQVRHTSMAPTIFYHHHSHCFHYNVSSPECGGSELCSVACC